LARPHRYAKRCGRECWSTAPIWNRTPHPRGWECFQGTSGFNVNPGLKPWAMVYNRFAVKPISPDSAMRHRSTLSPFIRTNAGNADNGYPCLEPAPLITNHLSPFDALNACSGQAFHQSPVTSHPPSHRTFRLLRRQMR